MLVQFNGIWLTNDGSGAYLERAWSSTIDSRLNGKEIVQEAQFMRAVTSTFFDRGNLSHSFTFKVSRNFQLLMPGAGNPIAQAGAFALMHFMTLQKSGPLVLQCGGWGETPIVVEAASAFLETVPEVTARGVIADVSYSFRFSTLAITSTPPQPIDDSTGASIKDSTGNAIIE